jgi:hypothetical protein
MSPPQEIPSKTFSSTRMEWEKPAFSKFGFTDDEPIDRDIFELQIQSFRDSHARD